MFTSFLHRYKSFLILIGFIILFIIMMTNAADNRKNTNDYLLKQAEDYSVSNNPGLNLDRPYMSIQDSVHYTKDWAASKLRARGEGFENTFVGVRKIEECDSCFSFDKQKFRADYKSKFFIVLSGYTLKEDASFIIKNGKYYISHVVWDKIYKNESKTGHDETKETLVRYSIGDINNGHPNGSLLLPVSESTYKMLKTVTWVVIIAAILFCIYAFFALPFKILFNIANGKSFTKENVRMIRFTGWSLIAIAVLPPLVSIIVEWILRATIPDEIYYPFLLNVIDGRPFIIAGLIVLLISNAFKAGYKLQTEQELTV